MADKSDKREFNRLDILGHVQIKRRVLDAPLDALIGDISFTGMRIHLKEHLSGRIEISRFCFVDVPGGEETEITDKVKGQVAWVKQKGKWYSVGIRFEGLNRQDHRAILTFLEKHLQIK
jgi:hypothetical protein